MQDDGKEIQKKKDTIRLAGCSRREFLQWAGIVIGSTALTALTMTSACTSSTTTTSKTTTANPSETSTSNTSTSASTQPSSSPPASSPASTTSGNATSSTTTSTTSTPVITSFYYVPPKTLPPLIGITGTCVAATDRVYSKDHFWVKSLSANMAVLGITTVFAEALMEPNKISLPTVGTAITKDIALGTIEGFKLAADLISPVSGQVMQVNELLNSLASENKFMDPIIEDPYNGGWMLVVQLTKPDELKGLLSAQSYRDLIISGK